MFYDSALFALNRTYMNIDSAFLALSWRYTRRKHSTTCVKIKKIHVYIIRKMNTDASKRIGIYNDSGEASAIQGV